MSNLYYIYICNSYILLMKERIIEFLKSENKSSAQLAEEIGVQPSGISHILSGRNNPSLDFVLKMLEKYPYLSSEWLLFGKGGIYKEATMQKLFDESFIPEKESVSYSVEKSPSPAKNTLKTPGTEIPETENESEVEKIVWFYKNSSFREYFPGQK